MSLKSLKDIIFMRTYFMTIKSFKVSKLISGLSSILSYKVRLSWCSSDFGGAGFMEVLTSINKGYK